MKFLPSLLSVKPLAQALWLGSALSLSITLSSVASANADSSTDDVQREAAALVGEMTIALKQLNYEGTFVHVQGTNITSMHILHSSDEHGELERLVSLDGEAREVIRNDSLVTCIWPGSESVIVSKSKPRDLLPQLDASLMDGKRYNFEMGPADRVAGMATHVVSVKPTDAHRYGYRFWIDQNTHMLLRSMLIEGPSKVIEQVMFTDINYPASIDADRFDVLPSDRQLSWLEPKRSDAQKGLPKAAVVKQTDRVDFETLPMGYAEVSETFTPMAGDDKPVSHVMLTDGMASVSVYVEYQEKADQNQGSRGLSTMGAMNAYGVSLDKVFITAVGEVPAETVKAIAKAVKIR